MSATILAFPQRKPTGIDPYELAYQRILAEQRAGLEPRPFAQVMAEVRAEQGQVSTAAWVNAFQCIREAKRAGRRPPKLADLIPQLRTLHPDEGPGAA